MTPTFQLRVQRVNLTGLTKRARRAIAAELGAIAEEVRTDYVRAIAQNPRRGKTVTRYKPKRVLNQSAVGDAPAGDRGLLANSAFVENDEAKLESIVGVGAIYAAALEFGDAQPGDTEEVPTYGPGARPALGPAVSRQRAGFEDRLARAAEGVLLSEEVP